MSIGTLLREAREQRGLDLLTVHDRLARPITQLEALEAGDLDHLPDQVLALSTLRRYAQFLGLDGDELALALLEQWTESGSAGPGSWAKEESNTGTNSSLARLVSPPEHLSAFTQTGPVPRIESGTNVGPGTVAGGNAIVVGPPTALVDAITPPRGTRTGARGHGARRAPAALRATTWTVLVAVLVGLAGLGLSHWRHDLMVQWHLAHQVRAGGTPAGGGGTAHDDADGSGTTPGGGSADPAGSGQGHGKKPAKANAVNLVGTDFQTSATYTVAASTFNVVVTTSAPCWVMVTTPTSATPLTSAVEDPNTTTSYTANGSITVEVGSAGVSVGIAINGANQFSVTPPQAPFTFTFNPATGV